MYYNHSGFPGGLRERTARVMKEKYPIEMVEKAIKSDVNYVLEISVDGNYCGNGPYTRRFTNEILDGPLESHALCRLDNRPQIKRHTRVILYYGKKHPDFYEAR